MQRADDVMPRRAQGRFARLWKAEAGLTVFTGLLVLEVFVVSPLVNLGILDTRLVNSAFSVVLVCGAIALHPGRILRGVVMILVAIAIGIRWVTTYQPVPWIVGAGFLLVALTLACFAAIVLKRVFATGPVTRHRIHGAVCAYLLFGLMWAAAYAFIESAFPQAFSVASTAESVETLAARFVYFSFVTLTTVGYGDITAVHPLARSFVTAEALTGQLYPAIIIGGLVSSALQTRSNA